MINDITNDPDEEIHWVRYGVKIFHAVSGLSTLQESQRVPLSVNSLFVKVSLQRHD
jgi:hypothetical protein